MRTEGIRNLKIFKVHSGNRTRNHPSCFMICIRHQILNGDQIKKNEMGGACGRYDGQERCIQDFGGETRGKKTVGRPRCRWDDRGKMHLQEVGWGGMDGIDVV